MGDAPGDSRRPERFALRPAADRRGRKAQPRESLARARTSGHELAAALLNRHGPIESFPEGVLGDQRERAMLFKTLATLRTDAPLFADVNEIEWKGPTPAWAEWPQRMADHRIEARVAKIVGARTSDSQ